jgi:ribonuclease Z
MSPTFYCYRAFANKIFEKGPFAMSINCQILGEPGRDNVVLARIDTGQALHRLQFDCGDSCITQLPPSEVVAVNHLFFSHLHMDHVGGFDLFFRHTYFREDRPNVVWGPPQTAEIMQHRFQGFVWNLNYNLPGSYIINDIYPDRVQSYRFELSEAFAIAHPNGEQIHNGTILENEAYMVQALEMDHMTPSMAYIVREKPRANIDAARMKEMGLSPGAWLKQVKNDDMDGAVETSIDGKNYSLDFMRRNLLVQKNGESMAYLTDFLLDQAAMDRLVPTIEGVGTVISECQYRHADLELARKNYHMTATLSAELARDAGAGRLLLFHLSSRYNQNEYKEILAEARAVFPETYFAKQWEFPD